MVSIFFLIQKTFHSHAIHLNLLQRIDVLFIHMDRKEFICTTFKFYSIHIREFKIGIQMDKNGLKILIP